MSSSPGVPNPATMLQVSCTAILVQLTIREGIEPATIFPHMSEEVRDTVKLYLAGHIVHWWAQCDAPGVVFVFAATSVEAVERLMADLPLVKEELVDLTMTRLGPLQPLKLLLSDSRGA